MVRPCPQPADHPQADHDGDDRPGGRGRSGGVLLVAEAWLSIAVHRPGRKGQCRSGRPAAHRADSLQDRPGHRRHFGAAGPSVRRPPQAGRLRPDRQGNRRRLRTDGKGPGLRRQPVRGKRPLPARAGNRTLAHHRHPAPGARGPCASGHSQAQRLHPPARCGQRLGGAGTTRRPGPGAQPGRCHRQSGGLQHSGHDPRTRHRGRPERPHALHRRPEQRCGAARCPVRTGAPPGKLLQPAHPRTAGADDRPGPGQSGNQRGHGFLGGRRGPRALQRRAGQAAQRAGQRHQHQRYRPAGPSGRHQQ